MRTTTDALRSVMKYVAQVLSPQPVLAEVWWDNAGSPLKWTTNGMVGGDVDVDLDGWQFLRAQDRHPALRVNDGTPAVFLSSELLADPRPAAILEGVDIATGLEVVANALPNQQEYEIRYWADRGEFEPPLARVKLVGSGVTRGPALLYDRVQPLSIECYPVPGETAEEAVLLVTQTMDALELGFRRQGFGLGRPLRIPLYDFDGVDIDQPGVERGPADYLEVVDFSMTPLPDPLDPRRQAVMVDLRVGWRVAVDHETLLDRQNEPVRGTRLVQSVAVEFDHST